MSADFEEMVGAVAVLPDIVGGGKDGFAAKGLVERKSPSETAAEIVRQALTGVVTEGIYPRE